MSRNEKRMKKKQNTIFCFVFCSCTTFRLIRFILCCSSSNSNSEHRTKRITEQSKTQKFFFLFLSFFYFLKFLDSSARQHNKCMLLEQFEYSRFPLLAIIIDVVAFALTSAIVIYLFFYSSF